MIVRMSDKSENNVIWTDSENTRQLLWEAYNGYVEHYNNYIMYRSLNRENPIINAGLVRYANFFYEESRIFFEKIKLDKEAVDKVNKIFLRPLKHEDFVFLRKFFNEFMFRSGIKNVLIQKDNRSGVEKVADKYQLN